MPLLSYSLILKEGRKMIGIEMHVTIKSLGGRGRIPDKIRQE